MKEKQANGGGGGGGKEKQTVYNKNEKLLFIGMQGKGLTIDEAR